MAFTNISNTETDLYRISLETTLTENCCANRKKSITKSKTKVFSSDIHSLKYVPYHEIHGLYSLSSLKPK